MTEKSSSTVSNLYFGSWLKRYRTEVLRWSQERLGREVGCPKKTIIKYELKLIQPSVAVALRMARTLQINEEDRNYFVAFARGKFRLVTIDYIPKRGQLPLLEPVVPLLSPVAIEMLFEFPEAVKVPCQQYLLYFVEFLRDVGIKATADLHEDAGRTLFTVTPDDKDEALHNIKEALEIYLHLPMNRNIAVIVSPETSIEVQKLSAQLHHLQSQLYLASAALQQKELTIQQRDITIQQQQALITSGQVFIQALQKEADNDEDSESLGTDIIKVKPWSVEAIPFEVDLPELLRRLKEKFGRKRLP